MIGVINVLSLRDNGRNRPLARGSSPESAGSPCNVTGDPKEIPQGSPFGEKEHSTHRPSRRRTHTELARNLHSFMPATRPELHLHGSN